MIKYILLFFISFNLFSLAPDGFVTDQAIIFSKEFKQELEKKLTRLSKNQGPEIAVVTLARIQQKTIEQSAKDIFNDFGIGKSKLNNGVLLLIDTGSRFVRIEVGLGLEKVVDEAFAGQVIEKIIKPSFKEGDYEKGTAQAIDQIIQKIEKDSKNNLNRKLILVSMFIGFMMLIVYLGRQTKFIDPNKTLINRYRNIVKMPNSSFGTKGFGGGKTRGSGASSRF